MSGDDPDRHLAHGARSITQAGAATVCYADANRSFKARYGYQVSIALSHTSFGADGVEAGWLIPTPYLRSKRLLSLVDQDVSGCAVAGTSTFVILHPYTCGTRVKSTTISYRAFGNIQSCSTSLWVPTLYSRASSILSRGEVNMPLHYKIEKLCEKRALVRLALKMLAMTA